jgi:hypothetical protein
MDSESSLFVVGRAGRSNFIDARLSFLLSIKLSSVIVNPM